MKQFYNIMRIQESIVQIILSDEEMIFKVPTSNNQHETIQKEQRVQEPSWEQLRDQARKKTLREQQQDAQKVAQITQPETQETNFVMYFSVERFHVSIVQEVPSERYLNQISTESLFDLLLLSFGMEIDLDRHADIHININIYKLLMQDNHKKSKIAEPFRMILSSPQSLPSEFLQHQKVRLDVPDSQKNFSKYQFLEIGVLKRCLITKMKEELQVPRQNTHAGIFELSGQSVLENQVEVLISLIRAKNEMKIDCRISDLNLIFTLPTAQKVIYILKDLIKTFDDLETQRGSIRKTLLQMYEHIIVRMSRNGGSFLSREQDFYMRLFSNYAYDNQIDPIKQQIAMNEGLQRLKTAWDMRKNTENLQIKVSSSNQKRASKAKEKAKAERTEVIEPIMKINAYLKSLSVYIPLDADTEQSQVLQLSVKSDFEMVQNTVQENTIDLTINDITKEEVLDDRTAIGFSLHQLTAQMIQSKNIIQHIQAYQHKPLVVARRFSISEDSSISSDFDHHDHDISLKRSVIIPPCRLNLSLDSHQEVKLDKSTTNIAINIEPLHISVGFKHIDFFNIIMSQVTHILAFMTTEQSTTSYYTSTAPAGDSLPPKKGKQSGVSSRKSTRRNTTIKKEHKTSEKIVIASSDKLILDTPKLKKYEVNRKLRGEGRHVTEIKVQIDKISLSLNDDSKTQDLPLIDAELKNIVASIKQVELVDDAGTFILKKMGVWKMLYPEKALEEAYLDINAFVYITINYYNPRSLAFEPLLEKWDFGVTLQQLASYTQMKIDISSEIPLNLNLTFGMALTLRNILNRLGKSIKQADVMRKVEEGHVVSTDEFEKTIDLRQKMQQENDKISANLINQILDSYEPGFIFENHLGLDMKLALHDEFSDDNLESSIFNADYDFKRKSQMSIHTTEKREMKFFSLEADPTKVLYKTFKDLSQLQKETLIYRSGGLHVETLEEDPIRIDFKLRGLKKISAVPIESLGVFSFKTKITENNMLQMHNKKTLFKSTAKEDQRTVGIIFNIKMEGTQKKISIESPLLIANNMKIPISIYIRTPLQLDQDVRDDQLATLQPGTVFKVPLTWLISETKIQLYLRTSYNQGGSPHLLLFKNLAKRFAPLPHISHLSQHHSRLLRLDQQHFAAMDIYAYTCFPKVQRLQNPPQYLISFNPPLMLSNYVFQPLQLNLQSNNLDEKPLIKVGPKETAYLDQLDARHANLEWLLHESSEISYRLFTQHFDLVQRASQLEGSLEKFKLKRGNGIVKQKTEKSKVKLVIEVRKVLHQNSEGYQENFELRERLYDYSSSYQVMVYPKYMIVNKTSLSLIADKQVFEPHSNNYFNTKHDKVCFKSPGYKLSDSIQINTVGLSGILALDLDNKEQVQLNQFLPNHEYIPQRLEFGLTISTASAPFNKTFVITIAPRYVLVNQLDSPVVIKQKGKGSQVLVKQKSSINFAFESKKERFLMFREPSHDELVGVSFGKALYPDLVSDETKFWTSPFSIDDVEDFQLCYPKSENFIKYFVQEDERQWYEASPDNDYQRFVRVIIKTQNEATIQVVITDPIQPEYEIVNKTATEVLFGQVQQESFIKTLTKLGKLTGNIEEFIIGQKFQVINPKTTLPFAWPDRVTTTRLFGIKMGGSIQEIDLEKVLEPTEVKSQDGNLVYQIQVKVSGNSKKLVISDPEDSSFRGDLTKAIFLQRLLKKQIGQKLALNVSLKGIGLSFIDETPQELLFLSFHDISLSLYQWLESRGDEDVGDIESNSRLRGSLSHLQLDNMINQTMPVILIPSKPLSKTEQETQGGGSEERLQIDEEVKEEYSIRRSKSSNRGSKCMPFIKVEEEKEPAEEPPFIQFIVSYAQSQTDVFRLRTLQFAMQEFIFQLDTSIFNSNLKFVLELIETFSDTTKSSQVTLSQHHPELFERAKNQKREEVCPDLDAKQEVLIFEDDSPNVNHAHKMQIELIHLGAIKAIITFRLEKRAVELDIADPTKAFGILNLFYTLFAAVASISQSPIAFKELILIDSFTTQDALLNQLIMNYVRQGVMQFYKLLGSSDIIGNPLGLVNKLGTGVYEFLSEPTKGLLKGPDEFVGGVGKGVQSLVSNVISGTFESMSRVTGSLYSVVKNVSGDKNAQIKKTEHIGEGIYYGVKGGVKELVFGVTGIVTKPIQKTREEGAKGFLKGLGSGIVGAITAPVTATLRAGTSLTQGVAASASSMGKYGRKMVDTNSMYSRFRAPRYINARNVISEYDEDLALVRQILVSKYFGKYAVDSIKFFTLLPLSKKNGDIMNADLSSSILIITEVMLLYFRLETSGKARGRPHRIFKTRLRKIQGCELNKVHTLNSQSMVARKSFSGRSIYHLVITCYSQVKGQKNVTLGSSEYAKFEKIYKLLSVLPYCEAVNRVKKQINKVELLEQSQ